MDLGPQTRPIGKTGLVQTKVYKINKFTFTLCVFRFLNIFAYPILLFAFVPNDKRNLLLVYGTYAPLAFLLVLSLVPFNTETCLKRFFSDSDSALASFIYCTSAHPLIKMVNLVMLFRTFCLLFSSERMRYNIGRGCCMFYSCSVNQ